MISYIGSLEAAVGWLVASSSFLNFQALKQLTAWVLTFQKRFRLQSNAECEQTNSIRSCYCLFIYAIFRWHEWGVRVIHTCWFTRHSCSFFYSFASLCKFVSLLENQITIVKRSSCRQQWKLFPSSMTLSVGPSFDSVVYSVSPIFKYIVNNLLKTSTENKQNALSPWSRYNLYKWKYECGMCQNK